MIIEVLFEFLNLCVLCALCGKELCFHFVEQTAFQESHHVFRYHFISPPDGLRRHSRVVRRQNDVRQGQKRIFRRQGLLIETSNRPRVFRSLRRRSSLPCPRCWPGRCLPECPRVSFFERPRGLEGAAFFRRRGYGSRSHPPGEEGDRREQSGGLPGRAARRRDGRSKLRLPCRSLWPGTLTADRCCRTR